MLATGNKSELAVGYATIYDAGSIGGYSPLKDVPKSLVWELARWRNAEAERRGETCCRSRRTPSPSRRRRSCGRGSSTATPCRTTSCWTRCSSATSTTTCDVAAIVADGFDAELVSRIARMVDGAEWKRRQYPPGTKISFKAFGRDRRVPITNRWRETGGYMPAPGGR